MNPPLQARLISTGFASRVAPSVIVAEVGATDGQEEIAA